MLEALQTYPCFLWTAVVLFTLMLGSFLNVVIVRLPKMLEQQFKEECQSFLETNTGIETSHTFNLAFPSSHCVYCRTPIRFYDNIPVFSYLFLRGKCRHCHKSISPRYLVVEGLTALMGIWCALHFGISTAALIAFSLAMILLVLTFIDFEHMLLPDNIVYLGLWGGLLGSALYPHLFIAPKAAITGAVIGYLALWSVFWVFKLLTGKEGLGQGDFKLLAFLGAWCGAAHLPAIIFIASTLGAIVGISLILMNRINREQPIPFGPYLAFAGWITYLYGSDIQQWYWQIVWM